MLPQPSKDRKGRSTLGLRELSSSPLAPAPLFMIIGGQEEWGAPPDCQRKEIKKLPAVLGQNLRSQVSKQLVQELPAGGSRAL